MFILLSIYDRTIIKPEDLSNIPFEEIVLIKIRSKYIGKVIIDKGLVVSVKSLIIRNNTIVEIEGVINVEYDTELIVFSPEQNDILYGKIIKSSEKGLLVDCDVCKVFISASQLPENSKYSEIEGIWSWELINNSFYYDLEEKVRLKVLDTKYNTSSDSYNISKSVEGNNIINVVSENKDKLRASDIMEISGTFNQSGLGPLLWWK
jgi:DNA-directed RNA polymerase subunit E'/Rpb7